MKVLVTGAPGTGKSFLVRYAHERGYDNFFDTDEVKNLCEWRDYETGTIIGPVESVNPTGGESWYQQNGWYWKKPKIDELLASSGNIVICGSADNVMEFYPIFDKIILLYKNREDIVSNLMQPGREQANGKDPEHHERIWKWQEKLLQTTAPFNPMIINENNVGTTLSKIADVISSD